MVLDTYLLVKALHIVAVVCWFAGLFYLPRLFVYHVNAAEAAKPMLQTMERKLYKFIMVPAMVATWGLGLFLLHLMPAWGMEGWIHAKIALVVLLTGFHHVCGSYVKKFAKNQNKKSEKFFRIFNEIPSILLILIVILAVTKPF